ncbi:antitoxin (plasmid) [Mycolicibacterium aubagnense]|uniref:antitoxin n=1 Tax=Mycolicibacterium aubagnense TaxID=319707 RepID=UPI0013F5B228|nr:antitoxin [Mycolicibacterium aubagnense]WGI36172.1 antitoxin [Mycolicibacterium aubagnense]
MSTPTTTIRVPVTTRDRLNAQARDRGISVVALLDEWSNRAERDAAFAAERAATLAEATNQAILEEDRDWEQTETDGLD